MALPSAFKVCLNNLNDNYSDTKACLHCSMIKQNLKHSNFYGLVKPYLDILKCL